jgi:predicted lipoprotein with Yx(FWY)xxD motif
MTVRTLVLLVVGVTLAGSAAFMGHPAHGASFTLNVATATVEGNSKAILTDARGFTLYYLTSDTPTSSACTAACAQAWPPLLSDTAPTGPSSLAGTLAVVHTANGPQVSYSGHPLYRYAGDTRPGQLSGYDLQGPRGGHWEIATATPAASDSRGSEKNGGY